MKKSLKEKYISSAFLLVLSTVVVKLIGAVYKIPLTAYIGAVGRGYFSTAYNLCLPIHSLTMGAFPIALTKLIGMYEAKGDGYKIKALRKASKRLFFIVGTSGLAIMLVFAKPYSHLISASPMGVYTIWALAPSIFFSCLCACHRAFCEGFLDMKCSAISQMLEAFTKMIFGLLFAKMAMGALMSEFTQSSTVLKMTASCEQEALSIIYPITSAAAMLGVTLGAVVSAVFASIYTHINHNKFIPDEVDTKDSFNELVMFSIGIVGATAVQGIAGFAESFSIQYCLSHYNSGVLANIFNTTETDVAAYVYGVYNTALDFKNLVPSLVMALGVSAVPAVSAAFESDSEKFSQLLTSIFKYSSVLSAMGGSFLALFGKELLTILYGKSSPDLIDCGSELLFYFGVTILPCCVASTAVFCTQALGYSRLTIFPFAVSAVIRVGLNFILIPISRINLLGAVISSLFGYALIMVWNMLIIRKKTNCRLSAMDIFIKPTVAMALTYFAVFTTMNTITVGLSKAVGLVINLALYAIICISLLFLLKILSKSELKIRIIC